MISNKVILMATVLVMAGCASSSDKAVKVDYSAAAKLTIPVFTSKWENGFVQVAAKDKKGCGEFGKNVLTGSYDKDISLPLEPEKDVFIHVSRAYGISSCESDEMFYASRGNEYIVNIELAGQTCAVSVFEIAPGVAKRKINTYLAYVSPVNAAKVCQNKDKF